VICEEGFYGWHVDRDALFDAVSVIAFREGGKAGPHKPPTGFVARGVTRIVKLWKIRQDAHDDCDAHRRFPFRATPL
jgi:hypothetical protein